MNSRAIAMSTMVALTIGGLVAGDEAQDKAVAVVMKWGGRLERNEKKMGRPVVVVSLFRTTVSDPDLKELTPFKQLRKLELRSTKITDAGIKELVAFKQLQELGLSGTRITDAGLKELTPLNELTRLELFSTKVTDKGLKELAAL